MLNVNLIDYFEGRLPAIHDGDEGYDMNEMREIYIARVEAEGKVVVTPSDRELQIDIDSEEHYAVFLRSAEVVLLNWGEACDIEIEEHPSSSGLPRRHITLTLPFDVTPWQRIALQAALGSDPIRELLSATRLMKGDVHPTLFVEEKNA